MMKNENLKMYGVEELSVLEINQENGGAFEVEAAMLMFGFFMGLNDAWDGLLLN